MPRIYFFATINDQRALMDFFIKRGLFIQPHLRGEKSFDENDLLSGKLKVCNVGRIPYDELEFTPRDDQLDKERRRKFGDRMLITPYTFPILEWRWSEHRDQYTLDGTLNWDVFDKIDSHFIPFILEEMNKKQGRRYREIIERYDPMCREMKKEFSAAQRWIRKNWDNLEKGGTWWYGPEAKALIDSGKATATSFIPGETTFEVVYYSDDNSETQRVKTKSWAVFDLLTRRNRKSKK